MAVDKVKALKFENSASGGTQIDYLPTEVKPTEDYLATKGLAFENLDTFLIDKTGRVLVEKFPDLYQNVTYSGNDPSVIEFFNSSSFINANRVARYDLTFSSNNLTVEAMKVYDTDGTTVLKTYTWTHTYSGSDYQSSGLVIT